MDRSQLLKLQATYRDGLLEDVLPFWLKHALDLQAGGFITSLNRDGTVVDTDKAVWQQGRFTWLLAKLYNEVEPKEEWLQAALHGEAFLSQHCFDPQDGRMWFHLDRMGQPIRKRRYAFSEAFAAIAYGELFKATGDVSFRRQAVSALEEFLRCSASNKNPKFTSTRPMKSLAVPMISIVTAQELRSSIAFEANASIDQHISAIASDHFNTEFGCVLEAVGPVGEFYDHFDGRMLNPGHAIEAAWFILREAKQRGLDEYTDLGCKILDASWNRGWDEEFGGLLYFVDVRRLPVQEYWQDMKFWWPQCEAIIATLLAYQLTGEQRYAQWHQQVHDWAHQHFPDHEHGEWFGYLHRDGRLSTPLKGNMWKGPFHIPRMQLTCWQLTDELLATD